eukprot:Hpha_TRINITY_DN16321_c3_g9::TRINITY_DN16321_c3_g9_i1::g.57823::m.57823
MLPVLNTPPTETKVRAFFKEGPWAECQQACLFRVQRWLDAKPALPPPFFSPEDGLRPEPGVVSFVRRNRNLYFGFLWTAPPAGGGGKVWEGAFQVGFGE